MRLSDEAQKTSTGLWGSRRPAARVLPALWHGNMPGMFGATPLLPPCHATGQRAAPGPHSLPALSRAWAYAGGEQLARVLYGLQSRMAPGDAALALGHSTAAVLALYKTAEIYETQKPRTYLAEAGEWMLET